MTDNLAELPILLFCCRCGFILGIVYDLLRFVRLGGGAVTTVLADLAFGAALFFLAGGMLLYIAEGKLNAYDLAAIFLCFLLWQRLPGRLVRGAISAAASAITARRRKKAERNGTVQA